MTDSTEKQTIPDISIDDDAKSKILSQQPASQQSESKQDVSSDTPEQLEQQEESDSDNIGLKLGDIIEINSPSNKSLDKHIFVITYIDENQISIIDSTTFESKELFITDGKLNDEERKAAMAARPKPGEGGKGKKSDGKGKENGKGKGKKKKES